MTPDSISILGQGAVSAQSKSDLRALYKRLVEKGLLTPVRQFGRFSFETQRVFLAAAAALDDAGLIGKIPAGTGIVHTSTDGALADNLTYFNDYLAGGRKLARANLFIYTLPTSPVGETAIHFRLDGPLYYIATSSLDSRELLLTEAQSLIKQGDAPLMLAVVSTPVRTTCLVAGHSMADTMPNHSKKSI